MAFHADPLPGMLTRAAVYSPLVAFAAQAVILTLLFRSIRAFHLESGKIDALVSEYVRCRDVLLATRRPSARSGWRSAEGEALREAWHNFNGRLERMREQYRTGQRASRMGLNLLLAAVVLNGINAVWFSMTSGGDLTSLLAATGQGLIGTLLWFATLRILVRLEVTIVRRTTGDYLISPWPSEGLSAERPDLSSFEKFLPVESVSPVPGPAPEVL